MLELNKISYSSMLSRKSSNLILLSYFAFVMLVLWSPESKTGKGRVSPSNWINDTGFGKCQETIMFCSIPCGQKKKKSLAAVITVYRNSHTLFCPLKFRHKIVIVLILLMQLSQ